MNVASCPRCRAPVAVAGRTCASCSDGIVAPATVTFEIASDVRDQLQARLELDPRCRPATVLTEGMRIGERFELVRWLGDGGMGSVWAARNVHTRRLMALKFIKPRDG